MLKRRMNRLQDEKPIGPLARIRSYLLQDGFGKVISLNEKEKQLHNVYTKCFAYMSAGYERRDVVKLLVANDNISDSNAHNVITNTLKLYGDIYKSSLNGQKAIERENYVRIARKAETAADAETEGDSKAKLLLVATKNRELASKISGTFEAETQKNQKVILPMVVISADKAALPQNNVIDIPNEEEEDLQ